MDRRALLVVSLAALFGLRAPLCVVACLEESVPAAASASAQHSPDAPPCHRSAPSSPEDTPASHHECDCDRFQVLLTKGESAKARGSGGASISVPLLASFFVPATERPSDRSWPRRRDLPPADLLLLKSTLLL